MARTSPVLPQLGILMKMALDQKARLVSAVQTTIDPVRPIPPAEEDRQV